MKKCVSLVVFNLMFVISTNHLFSCKINSAEANASIYQKKKKNLTPVNNKHVTFRFSTWNFLFLLGLWNYVEISLIYLKIWEKREGYMGIWKKIPLNRGEPFPSQHHHPKEQKSVSAKKPFPLLGINFFFTEIVHKPFYSEMAV